MRAAYLFVVMGYQPLPLAVFTVKHEMVTWLKRYPSRADLRIYRYGGYVPPDGATVTEMDIEELLQ